ncbi:MAG TPA: gamma-glutamylcyclotransferase [Cyclobacteriaceae bacterium]|nr:gamma-glutamylcyclotransferase [Cyclobacteriaceae bacterium]
MNKAGLYAFYGTLRLGMENHTLFERGMQFLNTVELKGFRLISLGEYPYAVKSTNPAQSIIAELFFLDDLTAKSIHDIEIEAGYYYDEIQIDQNLYGIYLFKEANPYDEEIGSGDWASFVARRGF